MAITQSGTIERAPDRQPAAGFDRIGFGLADRYSDWPVGGSLGLVRADQHRRLSTAAHDFAAVMDAGGGDVIWHWRRANLFSPDLCCGLADYFEYLRGR